MGSIAGDDTLLIIARNEEKAAEIAEKIDSIISVRSITEVMLNQLSIRNVAVIDELDINLHDGVSVLTGETGAGKSIMINSINMILGDRANKELVRYGTDKAAVVQAVFN